MRAAWILVCGSLVGCEAGGGGVPVDGTTSAAMDVGLVAGGDTAESDAAQDVAPATDAAGMLDLGSDAVSPAETTSVDLPPPCTSGDACDDGDACSVDVCTDSGCEHIRDTACDGIPCKACDSKTGQCEPTGDGQPCAGIYQGSGTSTKDKTQCSGKGLCAGGVCSVPKSAGLCDDGSPCTQDGCCGVTVYSFPGCSPAEFGTCVHVPPASWQNDCENKPSTNPCSAPICKGDSQSGWGCISLELTGPTCDDGNPCTVFDSCHHGFCQGGLSCGDDNPCTADACAPTGCVHSPETDGTLCYFGKTCQGGVCK